MGGEDHREREDSELIRRRHPIKESAHPSLIDPKYELEKVLLHCGVLERTRVDRLVARISVQLLDNLPRLLLAAPQVARCRADFAVGPFVLDFTNSAFDEKPAGGLTPTIFVASITVFPSMPCRLSRASAIAPPGTATTLASTSETSPPSRPILLTSWPALSQ